MTGNHLDADEIVQEVLIVLYNKLNTFEFNSSFIPGFTPLQIPEV